MEFKTQEQINQYINDRGLFLSDDKLFQKCGEYDWINIDSRKNRIISFIENNISPFSDNLTVTFPSIALSVFSNYENREESIAAHIELLEDIKESGKKLFNNKNWRLIKLEKHHKIENETIQYLIYDVSLKEYNPIKKQFLNDKDLKSAFEVKNIIVLNKLNNDNLKNRYESQYKNEVEKFDAIGVYKE